VQSLLAELGSSAPAPGGGSAAALAGAAAASLCAMVCRLTLARESCRPQWPEMTLALEESQRMQVRLQELVDEDALAYLAVAAARALPKDTPAQKESRNAAIQQAAVRAASIPLETLDAIRAAARVTEMVTAKGNPACRTDAGSAGALCRAGAEAAGYNVRVNLPAIRDEALRGTLAGRAREALAEIRAAADRTAKQTDEYLEERSSR
jgi:methenyltetrahydrofolate cyclohydrolase